MRLDGGVNPYSSLQLGRPSGVTAVMPSIRDYFIDYRI